VPSIADSDSSASVAGILGIGWFVASCHHGVPCWVQQMAPKPMLCMRKIFSSKCSGFFRDTNKNGMFLSFSLYKQMKTHLDSDILKAFTLLENPKFIYYA
jgi:hypothetical protein